MRGNFRLRRLASYGMMAVLALTLAACEQSHPNTTFTPHSDYGREIDFLWDRLLLLGTIVFVLVEAGLIYIMIRYRKRETDERPPQTHGNVVVEIIWTLIPAFILLFIAVPTVRTVFKTQAKAVAGALEIEVIGHQWWWEFRYPEYNITTANEIYLPTGRTVNFKLTSVDVIHSFWIPQLGGKRDAVTNRVNYIWLTPDSTMEPSEWNGFCTEYCGTSHANMRFRAYTVKPDQFASWVASQRAPAVFGAVAMGPPRAGPPTPVAEGGPAIRPGALAPTPPTPRADSVVTSPVVTVTQAGYIFPRNQPEFEYAKPKTPIPGGLTFTRGLTGNAHRGRQIFSTSACIGCHAIVGNPAAMGNIGPNLTHFGSRSTIGAGTFPNTPAYLALWLKNARLMKPGVLMPTLGMNEYDPVLKTRVTKAQGGLDDQQIADIVAYLWALK
ncbi:MAG: cytochrome c oxidase subunit II [Gemmatimonadota bacterium]|nr:cytochrome c oxidase subunit II [Gemmatimonadota bacterium]